MSSMVTPELRKPGPIRKFSQLLIQLLFILAVLGGLLFIPAGRLGWTDAWAYIIAYGVFLLSYAIWGSLKITGTTGRTQPVLEHQERQTLG